MNTVRLGKTDLYVSQLGMGGIPIQRPSADEATRIIHRAIDSGITFFDTANGYGESEARFGRAFAAKPGSREGVVIATRTSVRDAHTAEEHLALSPKSLRTETIDLWQFHNVSAVETYDQVLGPDGAMEVAQRALRDGRIRHIGITSHSLDVARKAVASGHFEMILYPFNFVNNEAEEKLLPLCREHDVGFVAMKPFAGGRLTDADLVVKYLLQFDDVVAVPGIERCEEIDQILTIAHAGCGITNEDLERMDRIRTELGGKFCQWCGYCMPVCPQEIYIPGVINVEVTTRLWPEDSWGRLAAPFGNARTCLQCGECETRCPYDLPIRELLVEGIASYERITAHRTA